LWQFLFSGDDVYFEVVNGSKVTVTYLKHKDIQKNRYYYEWYLGMSRKDREARAEEYRGSLDLQRKYSFEKYTWTPICPCCKKWHGSHRFDMTIEHFTQLMFLSGVSDRKDLPEYYRHFRSHIFTPGYANSILENVHPLAMLQHPSWRAFPNGIHLTAYLCRRCEKLLRKKHFKAPKTLITRDFSIRAFTEDEASKVRKSFVFR
jgi:hypothetical protein